MSAGWDAALVVGLLVGAAGLLVPRAAAGRLRALVPPEGGERRPGRGRRRAVLAGWTGWVLRRLPGRAPAPTDVAAVVTELASLVRGGLPPSAAWAAVRAGLVDDPAGRVLAAAASAGAHGDPVAQVLRAGDDAARARGLHGLAATVAVHERTGAPVADVLDRAAAGLRADADAELARRSALAAPLATARVLVALPPLGLLLGLGVGGDPVRVLLAEPVGRGCAVVGAVCAGAAWWWSRALVRRAVHA